MAIIIKDHAIEQFHKRVFRRNVSDEEAAKILKRTVEKGIIEGKRPGNAVSMIFEGISVVVQKVGNDQIVKTCLGDTVYKKWYRNNEILPRYKRRTA